MNAFPAANKTRTLVRVAALLVVALGVVAGCGKGGKETTVSGKVSYKGAPVTGGKIGFTPTAGGVTVDGVIRPDGNYLATDVPPGDVKVTVNTDMVKAAGAAGPMGMDPKMMAKHGVTPPPVTPKTAEGGGMATVYVPIPPKYKNPQTTTITKTINKGENKDVNIDLE